MRLNLMITSMEYDGPMRLCEFDGEQPGVGEDRGTVGRSKGSQFLIADASVSRQHFRVVCRAGRFWLRNLSKNGTSINGKRLLLQIDEEAPIATGDRIYAGEVEILVTVVETEPQRATPPAPAPATVSPLPSIDPLFPGFEAPRPPQPTNRPRREPQNTGDSPPRPAPPPIELEPAPASARSRTPLPDDFDLAALLGIGDAGASSPAPVLTSAPVATAPARVRVQTGPAIVPAASAAAAAVAVSVPVEQPGDNGVLRDILMAAGLSESRARELARNLRPADLGRVLAASVHAVASLQSVREKFARNFRLTTRDIAREGNNPFQHHDSDAQLLDRLFHPDSGFLSGAEAVSDAEIDLQRHQIAVAEAMRRAFLSLVECFRPEHFESEAPRGERKFFEALNPAAREAASWRAFREMYANNFADAQRAFLVIYLDRFRKDYEEVLAQTGTKGKKRPSSPPGN